MKHLQKGFTLIELIVVIVILGILSAVALPKFINFQDDATQAAVSGVAGGLASASAINYAAVAAGKSSSVTPSSITGCTDPNAWNMLTTGNPTSGNNTYSLTGSSTCSSTTNGTSIQCTVTLNNGSTSKSATTAMTCYGN